MGKTIKIKTVSYGTVEIIQNGTNYSIYVNGQLRDVYKSLDSALDAFNKFH